MHFSQFLQIFSQQFEKQLPFAIYAFPDARRISGYLQKDAILYIVDNLSQDGFVMAPFDVSEETVIIPRDFSEFIETTLEPMEVKKERVPLDEDKMVQEQHELLVRQTIDTIKSGSAKKIVIARLKDIPLSGFSLETLICQLFSAYPSVFRYVFYHPEIGIWCGATPETLVEVHRLEFKTMALAGTQPYKEGTVLWRKKELEEQHFVTEAIVADLQGDIKNLKVGPVETIQAGSLLHLKCDITGEMLDETGTLSRILNKMHPTPAVCGTPQDFARDFIIESEAKAREFYTGYVGPLTDGGISAAFFVNLRSMKIKDHQATLFIGGGITADSDPQEEWNETQNKMQTMLQVLQPML